MGTFTMCPAWTHRAHCDQIDGHIVKELNMCPLADACQEHGFFKLFSCPISFTIQAKPTLVQLFHLLTLFQTQEKINNALYSVP